MCAQIGAGGKTSYSESLAGKGGWEDETTAGRTDTLADLCKLEIFCPRRFGVGCASEGEGMVQAKALKQHPPEMSAPLPFPSLLCPLRATGKNVFGVWLSSAV